MLLLVLQNTHDLIKKGLDEVRQDANTAVSSVRQELADELSSVHSAQQEHQSLQQGLRTLLKGLHEQSEEIAKVRIRYLSFPTLTL